MNDARRISAGRWQGRAATAEGPAGLVLGLGLAFLVTAAPVFLHLIGQPLAILFCLVAAVVIVLGFEEHALTVVLGANIFQNIVVSIVSPQFSDFSEIEPLKSYNFITTISIWLTVCVQFLRDRASFSPFVRRVLLASIALLAVAGVYFVAGLAINSRNAIIYMRNIGLPVLMLQLFLVVGARRRISLPSIIAALLAIIMFCGYMELFFTDAWLTITNGWTYNSLNLAKRLVDMQEIQSNAREGRVITSPLDYSTSKFLNIGLPGAFDFMVARLQGPAFHPISFGYLLAIMAAFSIVDGVALIGWLTVPLVLATSAKGPLLLLFGSLGVCWLARRSGARRTVPVLLIALAANVTFVFLSGRANGDYHVLGLLGGLNGFLTADRPYARGRRKSLGAEFQCDRLDQVPAGRRSQSRRRKRRRRAVLSNGNHGHGGSGVLFLDRTHRLAPLRRDARAGVGLLGRSNVDPPRQRNFSGRSLFFSAFARTSDGLDRPHPRICGPRDRRAPRQRPRKADRRAGVWLPRSP